MPATACRERFAGRPYIEAEGKEARPQFEPLPGAAFPWPAVAECAGQFDHAARPRDDLPRPVADESMDGEVAPVVHLVIVAVPGESPARQPVRPRRHWVAAAVEGGVGVGVGGEVVRRPEQRRLGPVDGDEKLVQPPARCRFDDGACTRRLQFNAHRPILTRPVAQRQRGRHTWAVPRILLFDIDLTMVKTQGAGRTAMDAGFAREFGVEQATEGIHFDGRTDRGIFAEVLERHGFGGDALVANLQRFVEAYLEFLPGTLAEKGGEVLPGVEVLLDALAPSDALVGLATGNLRRGAALKLGHFGLWERFAGGGFGDDHSIRAELVRAGIAELAAHGGLRGEPDVIVLGDTPLDIEAAHLAGAKALGVATGRFSVTELLESGADFALPDLSDTPRTLDLLLG